MTDFSIRLEFCFVKENEEELLNLTQKIAEFKGIKIIICIDEFQNSVLQSPFLSVSLVLWFR